MYICIYTGQLIHLIHTGHTSGFYCNFLAPIAIADSKTGKGIFALTKRDVLDEIDREGCAATGGMVDGTVKNNIWCDYMNIYTSYDGHYDFDLENDEYVLDPEPDIMDNASKCWEHFYISLSGKSEHKDFPGSFLTDMKIYRRIIAAIFNTVIVSILKAWLEIPFGTSVRRPYGNNNMEWNSNFAVVFFLLINYYLIVHILHLSFASRFVYRGLKEYFKLCDVLERLKNYFCSQSPFYMISTALCS